MSPITADAFLFDGQGTAASTSPQTESIALRDAELPLGQALLLAFHQAFVRELSSLSADEKLSSGLDINAFTTSRSLLEIPQSLRTNAIIANTNLYLIQLLRYLAHADPSTVNDTSAIGFSTGMFAATVVATSDSIPSFFKNAVDMYRLAFWLGLRAQQYATSAQGSLGLVNPWSLVLLGSIREEVQEAVNAYNTTNVRFYANI